jgi:PhoH-like ATPase
MTKNFVLDSTVLLYDPAAIFSFQDNNIIIPITVIEETDKFKKDFTEVGRNARQFSRYLDKLRQQNKLCDGVRLENGGNLRVEIVRRLSPKLPSDQFAPTNDNKILSVALDLQERNGQLPVILVTKNTNLRIKADALGLAAQDYERDKIDIGELYTGVTHLTLTEEEITRFRYQRSHPVSGELYYPQIGVILHTESQPEKFELGRYSSEHKAIVALGPLSEGVWGIHPRNKEQSIALELLLEDKISLVTLTGISGTGKTLLALAAGLHKTTQEEKYQRLLVARPVFPLGKDIGFLPGDVEQKLSPWMQPIFDNVQLLMGTQERVKHKRRGYQDLMRLGMIEIEPLTYIRGRSLPKQYLIVDEAQNLTPHEIKTIITRAGEGTKVVLTGDPYQIDNPYLDSSSNGLSYVVEKFKGETIAGHINLIKGERSSLAELAASIL